MNKESGDFYKNDKLRTYGGEENEWSDEEFVREDGKLAMRVQTWLKARKEEDPSSTELEEFEKKFGSLLERMAAEKGQKKKGRKKKKVID